MSDFLMRLREGDADHPPLTASSAGRTVVAVRGFHRFCLREGLTAVDPAAAVKPPAPPQRLPKALSVDEVTRILAAAAGAEAEPAVLATRDAALLEFLYGTGARISEAVGLDVDDIDLGGRCGPAARQGQQGARGPGRVLRPRGVVGVPGPRPSGSGTAGHGTPALFLNARGGRLSRQSAWTVLRRAAQRAGDREGDLTAHAPALLRDTPAGRRCRRPRGPGAPGPRLRHDHPGLHAGHRRQAPRGLRNVPPASAVLVGSRRFGRRPDAGRSGTVCDHLVTVGHPDGVIGRVRSFVDKPPHPGAEWLVESA